MADGKHIEVAKAYVTIVPSLEGSQKTIATEMGAVMEPAAKETGEKSGKTFGESLAKGLKTTAAIIGGTLAAATAGAVATGKAFIGAANSVSAMGDSIGDNAAKLGISTRAYQEWDFVLKRAGSSIDAMKTSMKTLQTAAASNNDAFKTLGITTKELQTLSPEQLFDRTVTALQGVENTTTRTALASKLLGRGAMELGGVFDMTAKETEEAKQKMYDLGAYMSEDMISASDKYQDTMTDMQDSITGLKNKVVGDFLPGLTSVMSGLSKVFSGQDGIGKIQSGLGSVISNITSMAPQFFQVATVLINGLLQGFAPMLPSLVSSIFSFLQTGLLMLVSLIPQLTPVITEGLKGVGSALLTALPVLIQALIGVAQELVLWLASEENTATFVSGILQLVSVIAESLASSLEVLLPALINIIGQVADVLTRPDTLSTIIKSVLYIVGAVVVALVKALPEIGGVIVKTAVNAFNTLKQLGSQLISKIGPWLASVWSGIKTWFASLPSKLSGAFQAGKDTILGWGKSAVTWGADMIKNFISGIKRMASNLGSAIKNLAKNYIAKFLHFSVPDAGPLADADTWMPDFVDLMATGLKNAAPEMQAAVNDFAGNMSTTITATGIPSGLDAGSTYNGSPVTINVYASEGQDVNSLANVIADKLEAMTARKKVVYA
jgi:hypothetical protein